MVLEKNNLKTTEIWKYTIPNLFIWEWTKKITKWNYPNDEVTTYET
jgi:hypothetical protein